MLIRKTLTCLAVVLFSAAFPGRRAAAQETTTATTKKADKAKKTEDQPSAQKPEEPRRKDHEGEKKGAKCDPPKLQKGTGDNAKKDGYVCEASKDCDKACNLWRKHKDPSNNYDEFVAKQGEWAEATTEQRRNFKYYCQCEEAK